MLHEKQFDESGEPLLCDSCDYPGRVALYIGCMVSERCHGVQRKDILLCEVCATTHLSVQHKYPDQCNDSRLHKSLAILGNMILEAIREAK